MKVRAIVSFDDHKVHRFVEEGQEFELPEGVDWLKAGFVVPVPGVEVEMATQPVPERSKPVKKGKRPARKPTG